MEFGSRLNSLFLFFVCSAAVAAVGGPIWQRVAADCGRHISCHPKQYNNECLLQNAHGTIDMSLALREGHIDAGGMVDQASLKHLKQNNKSVKKVVACERGARDCRKITVVLEPPPSSSIALQAPAATMRSAISATVAPAKSERRAPSTLSTQTVPVLSLSSPSTCSVIILPLTSWPRAVRGAYEYEVRGGNDECGIEGVS